MNGITTDGKAVWALTHETLFRVEPSTGAETTELKLRDVDELAPSDLWVAGRGHFVLVSEAGTAGGSGVPVRDVG